MPHPNPILTLTTDFGAHGPYVAALKGVVLGLVPEVRLVDVCHSIAPQNILEGAFVLASIFDAFPPGTVHLVVVDPGVGTERALIAVRLGGQWVVAPDNGLFGGVLRLHRPEEIREIRNPALRRGPVSNTFHGRDILAPAAAHLLLKRDPGELGPPRPSVVQLANFEPRPDGDGLVGEVIYRDAFGNLITNVSAHRLAADDWVVELAGQRIEGLVHTYGDRPTGSLVALAGSSGWIEVASVNGDAGLSLGAGPGTTVWFRRRHATTTT